MNKTKIFNDYIKRYSHIQTFTKEELKELKKGFLKRGEGFCTKCWITTKKRRVLIARVEENVNVAFTKYWRCNICGNLSKTK